MSFYDWLHKPEPIWKENLEVCDTLMFYELEKMNVSRKKLEQILETLDKYGLFEEQVKNWWNSNYRNDRHLSISDT